AAVDDLAFLLGLLLQQEGAAAVRAGLRDRLVVGGEAAVGIALAAVEEAAPAALALDDLAPAALRTRQPELPRLLSRDVLALGVVAAGDERPEAAAAPGEVLAALGALLVDRGQLLHLQLSALAAHQALRDLAVGIVRAGQEGAVAALLQHQRLPVVGA